MNTRRRLIHRWYWLLRVLHLRAKARVTIAPDGSVHIDKLDPGESVVINATRSRR